MRAPEFWRRDGGPLGTLLSPLGWCYGLATRLRRTQVSPWRAPVPVICVGNALAGGAGKTPVALAVCRALKARGKAVHFLGRGYGGTAAGPLRVLADGHDAGLVGDEALLLARIATTWIARDRIAGARFAADGADVVVMDDGLQDPSVAKDVSLLVVDGGYGFGNGHMIPAGPLRESAATALARADAVVVIGDDAAGIGEWTQRLRPGVPVLGAELVPGPEIEALRRKPVVAFAGIGDPKKFFATLAAAGCRVVDEQAFPDHHPYSATDLTGLTARARGLDATLVTTEKDAVRLPADGRDRVAVLTVALKWDNDAHIDTLLNEISP